MKKVKYIEGIECPYCGNLNIGDNEICDVCESDMSFTDEEVGYSFK